MPGVPRAVLAAIVVALGLSMPVCPASAEVRNAYTVLSEQVDEGQSCVVSAVAAEELRSLPVEVRGPGLQARLEAVQAAGLTVLRGADGAILGVVDLRRGASGKGTGDYTVAASRLLAALPPDVLETQEEVVRSTTPPSLPSFPFRGLPQEAHAALAELLDCVGRRRGLEKGAHGRVNWETKRYVRQRRDGTRTFQRGRVPPGRCFLEPPIALSGGDVAASELPWALWEHADAPWAATACPEVPEGDVTVEAILGKLSAEGAPVRVHPSVRLGPRSRVHIFGQPGTVGALVWALQVCTGLGCRALTDAEESAELFYALRPQEDSLQYICSLPGRGYVSPLRTRIGQAMMAEEDYGHILPLHACWKIADLPLLYLWANSAGSQKARGEDTRSLLWVRYIELAVLQVRGRGGGASGVSFDLPVL